MNDQLKSCPFCGHEPSMRIGEHVGMVNGEQQMQEIMEWGAIIVCNNCGAAIDSYNNRTPEQAQQDVMERWNRRA